jgi:predicted site-specific integrase-resolvase
VVASLTEIASGINERRPQLGKGLQLIAEKKADTLVVEFKDRLARFGYDYLELFITTLGGRIEVMETTETKSPNEELVEDLIAIITSFSARIYGKRGKRVSDQVGELLRGELQNDHSRDDLAGDPTGSLS